MNSRAAFMTTAAAKRPEYALAVPRWRIRWPLLREPSRVVCSLHRNHFAKHPGMIGPAILRAKQVIVTRAADLKLNILITAGDDVVLQPQRRNEEAVNDILRRHHELDGAVDRHMKGIDYSLPSRVLHFPHPLLGNDEHRYFVAWRLIDFQENNGSPDKQSEKCQHRCARPSYFEPPAFLIVIPAIDIVAGPIANAEVKQKKKQQGQNKPADDDKTPEQKIDVSAIRRYARAPERYPLSPHPLRHSVFNRSTFFAVIARAGAIEAPASPACPSPARSEYARCRDCDRPIHSLASRLLRRS